MASPSEAVAAAAAQLEGIHVMASPTGAAVAVEEQPKSTHSAVTKSNSSTALIAHSPSDDDRWAAVMLLTRPCYTGDEAKDREAVEAHKQAMYNVMSFSPLPEGIEEFFRFIFPLKMKYAEKVAVEIKVSEFALTKLSLIL